MSKGSKKIGRKAEPTPAPIPVPAAAAAVAAGATATDTGTSWLDSADPRRRLIGKTVLIAVWIYVAALWLLALDQTFNWGIFGPRLPPMP